MAHRQISILGVPLGLGAGRFGAEAGYRAVRTARLREELDRLGHNVRDCGALAVPEANDPGNPRTRFLEEITDVCDRTADWMEGQLRDGYLPLVLGGDHSIGVGTVAGAAAHCRSQGGKLGLIWIDAHGDMNTPETSPSGNIHGMPLAASLGMGDRKLTHLRGFGPKVAPGNTILVGIRDIDEEESRLIDESGIRAFTTRDLDERGMFSVMHEAIEAACCGTIGVHVSLDMDALDPTIAPGVGTPVPGGLTYREAHLALEMIADSGRLISMDVVEVNPMLDAQNLTALMAVGLISSGLGKRIMPRRLARAK